MNVKTFLIIALVFMNPCLCMYQDAEQIGRVRVSYIETLVDKSTLAEIDEIKKSDPIASFRNHVESLVNERNGDIQSILNNLLSVTRMEKLVLKRNILKPKKREISELKSLLVIIDKLSFGESSGMTINTENVFIRLSYRCKSIYNDAITSILSRRITSLYDHCVLLARFRILETGIFAVEGFLFASLKHLLETRLQQKSLSNISPENHAKALLEVKKMSDFLSTPPYFP